MDTEEHKVRCKWGKQRKFLVEASGHLEREIKHHQEESPGLVEVLALVEEILEGGVFKEKLHTLKLSMIFNKYEREFVNFKDRKGTYGAVGRHISGRKDQGTKQASNKNYLTKIFAKVSNVT